MSQQTPISARLGRGLLAGAAAGAAGTTALNAVTYLDMAVRARPASSTPEQTVEKLSERTGIPVPGSEEEHANRLAGLGPLTGLAAGVGAGALLGLVRAVGWHPGAATGGLAAAVAAMVGGNGPMAAAGLTDPREWSLTDWLSDAIPHLAYGAVTGWVLQHLDS
jgi:hypothetical protein